jgi:phage regulator Rha-like protein
MNDIIAINPNQPLTMSSREIAELTEKRHADVMRDIRNMLSQLELTADGYAQNCADPQNRQTYSEYGSIQRIKFLLKRSFSVPRAVLSACY